MREKGEEGHEGERGGIREGVEGFGERGLEKEGFARNRDEGERVWLGYWGGGLVGMRKKGVVGQWVRWGGCMVMMDFEDMREKGLGEWGFG
ncbi:hypothetical protein Pyn_17234 [Prunus yedoensis var. nudiflora]|uniref:Uncharacterized protein n=1 Tax=Prunus yedoensis var. nudiflora TaxID=2094558 RepID=A0A314YWL3_PRUYE|nr:hypothetical protein Pyn_17234 [Prunus yedoensis var. nudiflora]